MAALARHLRPRRLGPGTLGLQLRRPHHRGPRLRHHRHHRPLHVVSPLDGRLPLPLGISLPLLVFLKLRHPITIVRRALVGKCHRQATG